jgi:drug/metabolite transporter (DMT)-like permease
MSSAQGDGGEPADVGPLETPPPADPIGPLAPDDSLGWWPDASLIGVALIWGINMPIMKLGLAGMDRFAFNALRLTLSAAVLVPLAWREAPKPATPENPPLPRPEGLWKRVVVYAVIASGFYQWLFLLGISNTTASNGSLIMATVPLWTALLAWLLLGDRLRGWAWLGLALVILGTLIVAVPQGGLAHGGRLLGNLYLLLAAMVWSLGTVLSRRVLPYFSPLRLAAISASLMLPFQFLLAGGGLGGVGPALRDQRTWLPLIYSGVLSTGLALPMWNYGVRWAGAPQAAAYQNLVPAVALATAWLALGEPVSITQFLGGALIVGGLVLLRRR